MKGLFELGRISVYPNALELLARLGVLPQLLSRHMWGDWGEADAVANTKSLAQGGGVSSAYWVTNGINAEKVWIFTNADRTFTTVQLQGD
jgi:hypothetical protein